MLENRINRRVILHGAITLAGTLAAVQLGSALKAQAHSTRSSQRKGILDRGGFTKWLFDHT